MTSCWKFNCFFPLILILFVLFCQSCTYPQDPENSFEEAQSNRLLVGLIDNPPFVQVAKDSFSGSEVQKLKNFAKAHNLEIKFIPGTESELVEKLENYELHIVAGGFTRQTIWKQKAGYTTPYDREDHVFLIPKGENRLLEKLEIFIFKNKKNK